jgi:hypothetical protein
MGKESKFAGRVGHILFVAVALSSSCVGEELDRCDEPLADGLVLMHGFVVVEPGEDCPTAEAVGPLETGDCCFVHQETCAFTERVTENVTSGSATSDGYGPSNDPTRDICIYQGIFEETGAAR